MKHALTLTLAMLFLPLLAPGQCIVVSADTSATIWQTVYSKDPDICPDRCTLKANWVLKLSAVEDTRRPCKDRLLHYQVIESCVYCPGMWQCMVKITQALEGAVDGAELHEKQGNGKLSAANRESGKRPGDPHLR